MRAIVLGVLLLAANIVWSNAYGGLAVPGCDDSREVEPRTTTQIAPSNAANVRGPDLSPTLRQSLSADDRPLGIPLT